MKHSFSLLLSVAMLAVLLAAGKRPQTIYMVGDSTMADRPDTTITAERGWGQLFPTFLTNDVVLRNHAKNGRSTKSFLVEGRWNDVLAQLHRGDVVIIQFGHNDTKQTDPVRYATIEQYQANLTKMINEAKKKGAQPVLCTPIARRYFSKETGELVNRHGAYPDAARRVAEATKVPLLDLNQITSDWLSAIGDSASVQYFAHMPAGRYSKYPEGKIDNTHLSEAGAWQVAKLAAEAIRKQDIKCLSKYIVVNDNAAVRYSIPCDIR
ncbi:MAG: rhamnogalacturonan acetylesterase [Paludibacter sp.]|nr:rhamnogalacturonan acetylesterase [Bacteroidales bacterium]MCM1068326.1 rhamnogalacturonan acetylesterase [Prevotella sp.]MCM1354046.1 rhamnogalacturonan acetylesterase [Bacteroides sp.]MCM1442112.1 rhamnogalacturonan acetylesterase [Muribaculum sp.]MCM1481995.1 rhamnogalacturonan acetylesterase [Paludibacter sp.]